MHVILDAGFIPLKCAHSLLQSPVLTGSQCEKYLCQWYWYFFFYPFPGLASDNCKEEVWMLIAGIWSVTSSLYHQKVGLAFCRLLHMTVNTTVAYSLIAGIMFMICIIWTFVKLCVPYFIQFLADQIAIIVIFWISLFHPSKNSVHLILDQNKCINKLLQTGYSYCYLSYYFW